MPHPKEEKTLILIKPDGVKRGLIGEIISRIEQRGLKVIALKMVWPKKKQIDDHYPKDKKWVSRLGEKTKKSYDEYGGSLQKTFGTEDLYKVGQEVRSWVMSYMASGPIVAVVVQGIHSIDMVRKIVGPSLPVFAEMGTIRGDYSVDSPMAANIDKRGIHNIIHASETPEESAHEIDHWFSVDEIHAYKRVEDDLMF
ncbi:MAG: nucleoside-diphosphate kinase [Parcubacteria group bacterium]|nr:nucleoside-diphosphate kinase [Parcubacteria group bacterium]